LIFRKFLIIVLVEKNKVSGRHWKSEIGLFPSKKHLINLSQHKALKKKIKRGLFLIYMPKM